MKLIRSRIVILVSLLSFVCFFFIHSASAQSSCSIVASNNGYDIQRCTGTTPYPRITLTNQTGPILVNTDDGSYRIHAGFPLAMYGIHWQSVSVSSNGVIYFGEGSSTEWSGGWPLDTTSSEIDALPAVAAFFCDLRTDSSGNIYYSVQGTAPNRQLIIRFDNVDYRVTTTTNLGISMDIVLRENNPLISVYYYKVDVPTSTVTMSLGVQSDDMLQATAVYASEHITTTIASNLRNSTFNFIWTGVDVDELPCGSLGYNFSALTSADLTFDDTTNRIFYAYRVCGIVSTSVCSQSTTAYESSICSATYSASGNWGTVTDLAIYMPSAEHWEYLPNGVQTILQDGGYCSATGAPRLVVIKYVCDVSSYPGKLATVTAPTSCSTILQVNTSLACGLGDRYIKPILPPNHNITSTLIGCVSYPGAFYSATLCPNPINTIPSIQTNPTKILNNEDDAVTTIDFPDSFHFYLEGVRYRKIHVSSNGYVTFGYSTMNDYSPDAFPRLGWTTTDYFPAIALTWTDLENTNFNGAIPYNGSISWSIEAITNITTGTIQKQFVLRFYKVEYYHYRYFATIDADVSFDLILTEGEASAIQVRYYSVFPNPFAYMTIGIHGSESWDSYVSILNYQQITNAVAYMLSGTTLTYYYTGVTDEHNCIFTHPSGFPSYDLSSLNMNDLVYTGDSNYNFYYHPCGIVNYSVCANSLATSFSSICQVNKAGTSTYALAANNPNAQLITFESPTSVVVTIQDGQYCGTINAPRKVNIRYLCDRASVTPNFYRVSELSTCVYDLYINTSLVCPSSTPRCSIVADGDEYDIQQCQYVPPQRSFSNPTTVLQGIDNNNVRIQPPWHIHLYGVPWDYFMISSNGLLFFGGASSTATTGTLPLSWSSYFDTLPVFAPFWMDLVADDDGHVTYGTEGGVGTRQFIIRYNNVVYQRSGTEKRYASFDMVFSENSKNTISVHYYRIDAPLTTLSSPLTIGIQSDDGVRYTVLYNSHIINTTTTSSLVNTTLNFIYNGLDTDSSECGGLGYNFTSISNQDWLFNDTSRRYLYYHRPCGQVKTPLCATGALSAETTMCQVGYGTGGVVNPNDFYDLGVYNPNAVYWNYLQPEGVQMILQDGQYCGAASNPRVLVVNYVCDQTAVSSPKFLSLTEPNTCVYIATMNTSLACGPGNRYQQPPQTGNNNVTSTLHDCISYNGAYYNATLCPNPNYYPLPLNNPTTILTGQDDLTSSITFASEFQFYLSGTLYSRVTISSNGVIEFGYGSTSSASPSPFPSLGFTTTDYYPIIAAFWTDLINRNDLSSYKPYNGSISYSYQTNTQGLKQFIIRFWEVDYYFYRSFLAMKADVSFDVILTEGNPGTIEVLYYHMYPNPYATVVVGYHGSESVNSYLSVINNNAFTHSLSSQLSGTVLKYTYTGKNARDICGLPGYPIGTIASSDLVFTGDSTYNFYFNPCGRVNISYCSNNAATFATSACQTTKSGSSAYALATYNPNSVTWSLESNGIIKSVTTNGAYCSGVGPRTVTTYFYCTPTATTPIFWRSSEPSACKYVFDVNTTAACYTPIPSSSTGSSFSSSSSGTSVPSSSSSASSIVSSSSSSGEILIPTDEGNSGLSTGQLAGIIIGSVCGGLIFLSLIIGCCCFGTLCGGKKKLSDASSSASSEPSNDTGRYKQQAEFSTTNSTMGEDGELETRTIEMEEMH